MPDNPRFSKVHASVMEMLQDAIFGRQPISGPRNRTWLPANMSDCEPERRALHHQHGQLWATSGKMQAAYPLP